ncbi:MAG: GNAT family N-acetyltransferase [Oscillospiraceae bacterium]|jgi:diamine N-acetyltransferase|nr:GNAT family N-acetyltransferase [Oscillospiraceae bacterium]
MFIKKDELTIRSVTPDDNYMELIIEVDGQPVGEMNCHNMGNKIAQISIEIEPAMRDKGYGTRFLRILIDELFTNYNYVKIILDVDINNHRARHVYKKLGFREVWAKPEDSVVYYELKTEML